MKHLVSRLATLAIAVPLTLTAMAGSAQANHVGATVPGCYGGGTQSTVICDFRVTVGSPYSPYTYDTTVPICAGTCQNVPVTLAWVASTGEPVDVCYSYTTGAGTPVSNCVGAGDVDSLVNQVGQILDENLYVVGELITQIGENLCNRYDVCW